jgi:hypothetical protein
VTALAPTTKEGGLAALATIQPIWVFYDGGRAAAGFKGQSGDCICRAIAIATRRPYEQVYAELTAIGWTSWRTYWRDDDGLYVPGGEARRRQRAYIEQLGWKWTPTMRIGSGCKVHLRADELPAGRLIVSVSGHLVAVVDGVIHDTYDCSRGGTRCVYGYWQAKVTRRRSGGPLHFVN